MPDLYSLKTLVPFLNSPDLPKRLLQVVLLTKANVFVSILSFEEQNPKIDLKRAASIAIQHQIKVHFHCLYFPGEMLPKSHRWYLILMRLYFLIPELISRAFCHLGSSS